MNKSIMDLKTHQWPKRWKTHAKRSQNLHSVTNSLICCAWFTRFIIVWNLVARKTQFFFLSCQKVLQLNNNTQMDLTILHTQHYCEAIITKLLSINSFRKLLMHKQPRRYSTGLVLRTGRHACWQIRRSPNIPSGCHHVNRGPNNQRICSVAQIVQKKKSEHFDGGAK